VKGAVIVAIDRMKTFLEVEMVKTIVVQTDDGWFGGRKPHEVTVVERV
jgi:hypothetical protein